MSTYATATIPTGRWTSRNAEETFELGVLVGSHLMGGVLILLDGTLGAGKTVFAKGIASALGIDREEVTSPSFTLVNIYEGRLKLYHLDLYRLSQGASAAHAVDLDELLLDEHAVFVIEWAERMGRYPLPPSVWKVFLDGDGEGPREITIRG